MGILENLTILSNTDRQTDGVFVLKVFFPFLNNLKKFFIFCHFKKQPKFATWQSMSLSRFRLSINKLLI